MQRRRLLAALGAGAALLGGCVGRLPDESADPPASTTTDPAGTGSTITTDGSRELSITDVETESFTHALRINDLGEAPYGSVPSTAELDEREREVVEAALSGGYETDEPPDWLAGFVSGTPHVTRDGRYYRLSADLPTYTVTAEPTSETDVDGEIASNEAYRDAVTHDGVVATGLLRIARREGFRTIDPWPKLLAFLDRYDAVRYRGELLAVSVEVDDPGPPYTVTAEAQTLDEVAGRSVWNVGEADPAVRETIRAAGQASGLYPLDDPPDGLLDGLDGHDRVFLDGRFYTTYVEKRDPLPVSMTATAPNPTLDGEATLRLALRNDADREIEVFTGAPPPFGVLSYHPAGNPDDRTLLWTDAYEESDHVFVENGTVSMVQDIGLTVAVEPGGEVARTFTVRETDLPAGEYVVEDSVGVEPGTDADGTFPYRVRFQVG